MGAGSIQGLGAHLRHGAGDAWTSGNARFPDSEMNMTPLVEPLGLIRPPALGLHLSLLRLDVLIVPAAVGVSILALWGTVVLRRPLPPDLKLLPTLGIAAHWHILMGSIASFISNAISILSLTILMPLDIMTLGSWY